MHGIDLSFPADENLREKLVGFSPRSDHFIGCACAENFTN
jgi:hypothetical protein